MDIFSIIKNNGHSVTEVAEKMGIAQSTLSMSIKRGNPTVKTLEKMAEAMNINVVEFFPKELDAYIKSYIQSSSQCLDGVEVTMNGKRYGLVELQ